MAFSSWQAILLSIVQLTYLQGGKSQWQDFVFRPTHCDFIWEHLSRRKNSYFSLKKLKLLNCMVDVTHCNANTLYSPV